MKSNSVKRVTEKELKQIEAAHRLWLDGDPSGCRADLIGADLRHADLHGADFRGADFTGADFAGADLSNAVFFRADLSGANFRSAILRGTNFTSAILRRATFDTVPIIENIHAAVYAAASQALDMSDWNSCDTTHRLAEWVVTLAGEAGRELEKQIGSATAAALIYQASDPGLARIPDFYSININMMDEIQLLATMPRPIMGNAIASEFFLHDEDRYFKNCRCYFSDTGDADGWGFWVQADGKVIKDTISADGSMPPTKIVEACQLAAVKYMHSVKYMDGRMQVQKHRSK